MMKKLLESLEDPQKPLMGPNYWFMTKMGLILPEDRLKRYMYIIIHEIAVCFVLSQYIELYVFKSDLDEILTNLKISMLSTVCVIKANTLIAWQKKLKEVIDYVTESDIYERQNPTKISDRVIKKYHKYCRNVTFSYWALVFSTFVTTTSTPLMKYLSSSSFRERFKAGEELFPHVFSSWMPFNKYESPGCWITVVWHSIICAYGASLTACYDSCSVTIKVFFGAKMELMRERCAEMAGRGERRLSDQETTSLVRHLHHMYIELTKYIRLFNSVLSPVMFVYLLMCSLMLCCSAYQLTSSQNTTQKLLTAEYLIFGVSQLFVFCWHSNDVLYKSMELMHGPYESEWWETSISQQRNMLTLAGQFQIHHVFTAGPFTNLTLYSFITILKCAYSYYTLLRD